MSPEERLERYAELTVRVGANVSPGQIVTAAGLVEHAPFLRAIARAAYSAGARYVDVNYIDQHVRKAMIELAPEETLTWSPPWLITRAEYLGAEHGASIYVTGDPEPELLADLDGERVGKARMRELAKVGFRLLGERATSWTIVAFPNEGWARTVFGEPDVDRLWEAVARAVRLDEPDPVAAWAEHGDRLKARAELMTSAASTESASAAPAPTSSSACYRRRTGKVGGTRPRWVSGTSPTCRPRRSSRLRTETARRGRSALRARSPSPERWCATWRCASQQGGSSR